MVRDRTVCVKKIENFTVGSIRSQFVRTKGTRWLENSGNLCGRDTRENSSLKRESRQKRERESGNVDIRTCATAPARVRLDDRRRASTPVCSRRVKLEERKEGGGAEERKGVGRATREFRVRLGSAYPLPCPLEETEKHSGGRLKPSGGCCGVGGFTSERIQSIGERPTVLLYVYIYLQCGEQLLRPVYVCIACGGSRAY